MAKQSSTHRAPSFEVNIRVLPSKGLPVKLEAENEEREFLANEASALSVDSFHCDLTFTRWRREGVKGVGHIRATLIQQCVATLEPVAAQINEKFERLFLPQGSRLARPSLNRDGEMVLDADGPDLPDLFTGESLDAWEIAIEQFLLALDPFPRKEGVEFVQTDAHNQEEDFCQSPFAVLKTLK